MLCVCRVREAPDRFRAVQTYRAAMAVMAYQRAFVHKLWSTGIVADGELEVFEEVRTPLPLFLLSLR